MRFSSGDKSCTAVNPRNESYLENEQLVDYVNGSGDIALSNGDIVFLVS